jgi:hypothetical protein
LLDAGEEVFHFAGRVVIHTQDPPKLVSALNLIACRARISVVTTVLCFRPHIRLERFVRVITCTTLTVASLHIVSAVSDVYFAAFRCGTTRDWALGD